MTDSAANAATTRAMVSRKNSVAGLWFSGAVLAFIIDRFFKLLALERGSIVDPGWFEFSLFRNNGIAFSLPLSQTIFWPLALIIFTVLVYMFVRAWSTDRVRAGMLVTVLLGAVSNLADRAMYGWTNDYLMFFGRSAVNIADGMIVVGLVALYWHGTRHAGRTFSDTMGGK